MSSYKVEKIVPYNSSDRKSTQVEQMFDEIAGHYDELNHTLSMGIDRRWRKKGILSLKDLNPQKILDIATGTGDLAIDAYNSLQPDQILGIDISEGMMEIGRRKVAKLGLSDKITFEKQDCTGLQLPDNSFDAAIVAFGIRNFENLDKGLQEILRILRPNGKLMILELTTPEYFPMKQAYFIYSKLVIPTLGKFISKNKTAYNYLPKSIAAFPQGKTMAGVLKKNGFKTPTFKRFTFGTCTMYTGIK
ncbi:MAG: bifunctional demethylmenaquinone methyltransferase/2-methoxy-6-polyprenyl-1,4-benzoquinol methylase UbiE [Dysgonamonadaceae bacterium]|jgi:demethylmenaquinone methyltransferase/2-methoxy-6-polyprenyl-1,4-benzoquinol methylase|nr:bifunctional demethylmenaquinone methyltransferase/2-methoxy-6-polyprenyl-1,4-benzoquinol methylase UbiE [Dysgonamonadaceae bacterium]